MIFVLSILDKTNFKMGSDNSKEKIRVKDYAKESNTYECDLTCEVCGKKCFKGFFF